MCSASNSFFLRYKLLYFLIYINIYVYILILAFNFIFVYLYIILYSYTYEVQSEQMSQVFSGFCRTPVHTKTKQSTYKASKHNKGAFYLRLLTCVSTLSFIIYRLCILLTHYLCQLPFSTPSIGQDSDSVAAIVIACLFSRVGHRRRRHRQSLIQYVGVGMPPLLEVPDRET